MVFFGGDDIVDMLSSRIFCLTQGLQLNKKQIIVRYCHLPNGLVVRIRRSHRRGPGSIPGVGTIRLFVVVVHIFLIFFVIFLFDFIIVTINLIHLLAAILIRINYLSLSLCYFFYDFPWYFSEEMTLSIIYYH